MSKAWDDVASEVARRFQSEYNPTPLQFAHIREADYSPCTGDVQLYRDEAQMRLIVRVRLGDINLTRPLHRTGYTEFEDPRPKILGAIEEAIELYEEREEKL